MKRYLGVLALALVFSSISTVGFAADISRAQQDDTFLKGLAEQAQAPISSPALAPPKALPAAGCIRLNCAHDWQCWPHCGGEGASYCSSNNWCIPY